MRVPKTRTMKTKTMCANSFEDNLFVLQVADFGLTKLIETEGGSMNTRLVGTFGYMAPE